MPDRFPKVHVGPAAQVALDCTCGNAAKKSIDRGVLTFRCGTCGKLWRVTFHQVGIGVIDYQIELLERYQLADTQSIERKS